MSQLLPIINNKEIITYLLGAGASAKSLPIVKNYSKRFENIINLLNSLKNNTNDQKKKNEIDEICKDFKWLIENIKSISVDSFAYELYKKNNSDELEKLKKLLVFFFNIEQSRNPVDKRYLSFIEKIWPGKRSDLPNNWIRILNWNYDFQIEMALADLANYSNSFCSTDLQRQCLPSTLPLYEDSIQPNYYEKFAADQFSIFHLNGVCYCHKYDDRKAHITQAGTVPLPLTFIFDPFEKNRKPIEETLETQIFNYNILLNRKGHSTALEFAWEISENNRPPDNIRNKVFDKALEATTESETLVVIGYSFPNDNFKFDKQLISAMKNIKKVFFQDPNSKKIKKRFTLLFPELEDAQFFSIEDVEDFVVPEI